MKLPILEKDLPNFQREEIRIRATKITFTLIAESTGKMPYYSSSIWRGMWGREIKNKSCLYPKKECKVCTHMPYCAYGSVFEPTSKAFAEHLAENRPFISPPIVIEAPFFTKETWHRGEEAELTMLFFGDAVKFLYHFVDSLITIGTKFGVGPNRIKFQMDKVEQVLKNGTRYALNHRQNRDLRVFLEEYAWREEENPVRDLLISFDAPIRMQKQGTILTGLDLQEFFLNCQRRMEYLTNLYGNQVLLSKERLVQIVSQYSVEQEHVIWQDWDRFSAKQRKAMNLGGLMGTFRLKGNLTPILPMLQCASFAHIGKQTVFGLGKFSIYQPI